MALQVAQVNFRARDDAALGRFWTQALGWVIVGEEPGVTSLTPAGFHWPHPSAVCLDMVTDPDAEAVRYRMHLHLATASPVQHRELVERLIGLGATPAGQGPHDSFGTVLADPEGNLFCVLPPSDIHQGTGPIAAVVLDCADPPHLAHFWSEAAGWTVHESVADFARLRHPQGVGPYLELDRRPHLPTDHHRAHIDLLPPAGSRQAAEVERLQRLGARLADIGQGDVPWTVMTDPAGNAFCVLRER
jgi:Glyoxalase-like domain